MLNYEEYLQNCFQTGITKTSEIASKLETEIILYEKEISVGLQSLKEKKIYCEQLKQFLQRLLPKKKTFSSDEELKEEFGPEVKDVFFRLISLIEKENDNFAISPRVLANCLSLSLNDIYFVLKHLQSTQILMRDAEQNILCGPQWEKRKEIYSFLINYD